MTDIAILKKYFIHRNDVYAVMCRNEYQKRDNYYDRVFEPITDNVIQKHLSGEITIAIFPTNIEDQTVKWVCWDIDSGEEIDLLKVKAVCNRFGFNPIIEASGKEGRLHVWHFFDEPRPLVEVYKLKYECCTRGGIDFFPNQEKVIDDFYYELPIKLPLGYHRKEKKWSKFLNNNLEEISIHDAFNIT
jgi:hypothetical protein